MTETQIHNIHLKYTAPDLIEIEVTSDTQLSESHMRGITDFANDLEQKGPFIFLYRVTDGTLILKSAREYMATAHANKDRKGAVVIVHTTAQRILGDGFVNINQPPVPMIMVRSEEEALRAIEDLRG